MFVFITVTGKNRSGYIPHESKIKLFHSHTLCKHSHTLQAFTHFANIHTQIAHTHSQTKTTNLSEEEGSLCGVLRWVSGHVGGLEWEHSTK